MAGYDVEIEVTCTEGGASSGDDLLTDRGLANLSSSMRMSLGRVLFPLRVSTSVRRSRWRIIAM